MQIDELPIKQQILSALKSLGFTDLTPIQTKAIPLILSGKDIVGQSETGSGKTGAFGIPILEKIERGQGLSALILTPTRELCVQVTQALQSFSKGTGIRVISIYGGVAIGPQMDLLRVADIVVATPGRTLDHMQRRTIDLSKVKFFVLDEADKMLEMGFIEDVEMIMRRLPKERQSLLFSATLPHDILQLVAKHQKSPTVIRNKIHVDKTLLRQVYYVVPQYDKFSLLLHLLNQHQDGLSLVFCATRREADVITHNLLSNNIKAQAIHGGLTQSRRLQALHDLANEHINILVATDVAARGLDIKNVSHVYNYDVPKTSQDYVHRIGRTARAGAQGDAVTLLSERDYDNFNNVLRDHTIEIKEEEMPSFPRIKFIRAERNEQSFGRGPPRSGGYGNRGGGERRSSYGGSRSHSGPRSNAGPRHSSGSRPHSGPRHGGNRSSGTGGHRSHSSSSHSNNS